MAICDRVRDGIWRYLDRELAAPEIAEISGHLKSCPECSRLYEARAREANLYRMAFVDAPFGEGFVERLRRRIAEERLPAPEEAPEEAGTEAPGGIRRIFADRTASRRLFGRWALAAALATIAASVIFGLKGIGVLGKVEISGNVVLSRDGKESGSPADFRPGDQLILAGPKDQVTLGFNDGSRVRIEGPARFVVDPYASARGDFLGSLEEGVLTASVTHRREGRCFEIRTPDAVATVVGTEFTLEVIPQVGTTLRVREGTVRFSEKPGEPGKPVVASQDRFAGPGPDPHAPVAADVPAAPAVPEPAVEPAPPAPVEPADLPAPAPVSKPSDVNLDQPQDSAPAGDE